MNRDTLHRLWQQALMQSVADGEDFTRYQFAANFAALIEAHLKSQGYRQCAKGQRTTQYCGMVEQAVQAEREACAELVWPTKQVKVWSDDEITAMTGAFNRAQEKHGWYETIMATGAAALKSRAAAIRSRK